MTRDKETNRLWQRFYTSRARSNLCAARLAAGLDLGTGMRPSEVVTLLDRQMWLRRIEFDLHAKRERRTVALTDLDDLLSVLNADHLAGGTVGFVDQVGDLLTEALDLKEREKCGAND